jgi:hypothetical protein
VSRWGGEERFLVPTMTLCMSKLQLLFDDNGWVVGFTCSFLCFRDAITKACFYFSISSSIMFVSQCFVFIYNVRYFRCHKYVASYAGDTPRSFVQSSHYFLFDINQKCTLLKLPNIKYIYFEANGRTGTKRKNAVFWDVAPCSFCVNWRVGGFYNLHLQGKKSASEEPAWVSTCSCWFIARRLFYFEDGGYMILRNVG